MTGLQNVCKNKAFSKPVYDCSPVLERQCYNKALFPERQCWKGSAGKAVFPERQCFQKGLSPTYCAVCIHPP
jgi:hypothetical protein